MPIHISHDRGCIVRTQLASIAVYHHHQMLRRHTVWLLLARISGQAGFAGHTLYEQWGIEP